MTVHRKLDDLPNKIKKIEHFWITLKDGCRLAARMWLPEDAETHPVPAVLEYIPYRKRDGTRGRDEPMHGYFAGHGYAAIRVDMRGSGESDGVLQDEYLQLELDDAVEVIDWITRQPWCDGKVGMMGKSWGGFNCLQVAAMRPPALKAVLSVCSTDDRYADDIHYMGGCLLNDNHWWGAIMLGFQARPADPLLFGQGWRENWLKRLNEMPFWPAAWMKHQVRDAYWRHGSICEDYGAIQCPVMLVGGWADAYTNAIPRMLEHLKVPRRAIIGPWAHLYPHDGMPGPAIGFLQEAVKWWDHWLKGTSNGAMDGPMLWAWLEDGAQPTTTATAAITAPAPLEKLLGQSVQRLLVRPIQLARYGFRFAHGFALEQRIVFKRSSARRYRLLAAAGVMPTRPTTAPVESLHRQPLRSLELRRFYTFIRRCLHT